jgi:hypothetical protein
MDEARTTTEPRRLSTALLLLACLLGVVLPLSACGGNSSPDKRPSVNEIADSLTTGPLGEQLGLDATGAPTSTFTCIAQKLEGSELSDAALQAMVDADDSFQPSDADQKALTDLPSQIATCVSP